MASATVFPAPLLRRVRWLELEISQLSGHLAALRSLAYEWELPRWLDELQAIMDGQIGFSATYLDLVREATDTEVETWLSAKLADSQR